MLVGDRRVHGCNGTSRLSTYNVVEAAGVIFCYYKSINDKAFFCLTSILNVCSSVQCFKHTLKHLPNQVFSKGCSALGRIVQCVPTFLSNRKWYSHSDLKLDKNLSLQKASI